MCCRQHLGGGQSRKPLQRKRLCLFSYLGCALPLPGVAKLVTIVLTKSFFAIKIKLQDKILLSSCSRTSHPCLCPITVSSDSIWKSGTLKSCTCPPQWLKSPFLENELSLFSRNKINVIVTNIYFHQIFNYFPLKLWSHLFLFKNKPQ